MCLSIQARSGLSDTDIKLLGPRLKAVSDSFLKNSQENEMKIKSMESQFVNATADMRRLMEADLRAERQSYEAKVRRVILATCAPMPRNPRPSNRPRAPLIPQSDVLKKQIQEERLRGEQKCQRLKDEVRR